MLDFRCWYCNRLHSRPVEQIGKQFYCSCECLLRVPPRPFGNSRVHTFVDFLATTAVYGGGGAFLGLCMAALLFVGVRGWFVRLEFAFAVFLALPMIGLVLGTVFGERGINWIGRMIRANEDLPR
jgi:hypothetical protein